MSTQFDQNAAGTMPKEKFDYTATNFWPKVFTASFGWVEAENVVGIIDSVQNGSCAPTYR